MRPRLLIVVALCVAALTCARREPIAAGSPVIIISIDTLRSDHLPAYGYTGVATPAIDAFRRDAILFQRAYASCPLTLVSHASVFTGDPPSEHGIRDNIGYKLSPNRKTLAEVLAAKGYATGGAVSTIVLRGDSGINRGFELWNDDIDPDPMLLSLGRGQRGGDATREIAQKWIGEHESKPFFFFLHIYEPHTPYEPVEPFRSRYGATYDGEVATADAVVGRFLTYLREQKIYDRAMILLISDHGEGLGDHGEEEHGILLYREALQVPLMLKLPGPAGQARSVAAPVQLTDIMPTIVRSLRAGPDQRVSLVDVADGKVKDERPLYAESFYARFHFGWSDLHSIIGGANHYIHAPSPELYDIVAEPGERKNLVNENRRAYSTLRAQVTSRIRPAAAPTASEEQKRQLTALGYIGSVVPAPSGAQLRDPKDNIQTVREIGETFRSFREQRFEETVAAVSRLLAQNPAMLDLWAMKARALERLGQYEEAIGAAKEGLRRAPQPANFAMLVAELSIEGRRFDAAEQHARLALRDSPSEAHQLLAEVALARKDYAAARGEIDSLSTDPHARPAGLVLAGRLAQAEGKPDEALSQYDAAAGLLEANHRRAPPKLNFYRGDVLVNLSRDKEAEAAFRKEIGLYPTDPQPYKNLIVLYALQNRNREATELIFALEKAAPTPVTYRAIADVLKVIGDQEGAKFWAARAHNAKR